MCTHRDRKPGEGNVVGMLAYWGQRAAIYGKASQILEDFPYRVIFQCVGILPMYGKAFHIYEVFPYLGRLLIYGGVFPYLGRLPIYVKSSHIYVCIYTYMCIYIYMSIYICIYMGSLPVQGKSSHIWEVFPYMERLPTYGKTSHIWAVFASQIQQLRQHVCSCVTLADNLWFSKLWSWVRPWR